MTSPSASDDLAEIVAGKFYWTALKRADSLRTSHVAASSITFSIDDELLFEPFFSDFGPLNLGKSWVYCQKAMHLLQEAERQKKRLIHYCGPHPHMRANSAVLVGMYQILYLGRSADEAYKPLMAFKPFVPFRDASCGVSSFHLTVLDCLKGIQKARDVGFIDWNSGNSSWSIEEYQHYEQVENGDLNWIMPGKLLAFSGPAARSNEVPGYRLHTPEDYWDYYRRKNVTAVVRLNKKVYDRRRFTDGGFRHYDLYFPDGTCPTEATLLKWLEIAEAEPGGLAIHCKAGLGRTGILICAYIMKHYRFTAEEMIGYIRICRPGSVIGPQQNFICDIQARMWHEGDVHRTQRGLSRGGAAIGFGAQDMLVSGKPAIAEPSAADVSTPYRGNSAASGGLTGYGVQRSARVDSAPMTTNTADMSLLQYKMYSGTPSNSSPVGAYSASSGRGSATSSAGTGSRGYAGRSITPMRYGSGASSTASGFGYSGSGGSSILSYEGGSSITPPASPTASSLQRSGSGGSGSTYLGGGISALSRSQPGFRAPSADRAVERVAISSLRATLHTDTLRAADRPRANLDRNFAQSADIGSMRVNGTVVGGASRGGTAGGVPQQLVQPRHGAPIARTLAPNGQPRKVPVAVLSQYTHYHAGMASSRPGGIVPTSSSSVRQSLQSK